MPDASTNDPLIIFENAHVLVVCKPSGINTHSPSPFAPDGLFEFLRRRLEPGNSLSILQRLDKETSGVMVFGKSTEGNRSLSQQFETRSIRKLYRFLTDRPVSIQKLRTRTAIVRNGDHYLARPEHAGCEIAETEFRVLGSEKGYTLVEAEPITGRTHQIRVHASANGFPILGDTLYGGTAFARVCLHAFELSLQVPGTEERKTFSAPASFFDDSRKLLRKAVMGAGETNGYRLLHGAGDGRPDFYLDRVGDFILAQSIHALRESDLQLVAQAMQENGSRGAYWKQLVGKVGSAKEMSPKHILGEEAPPEFCIQENGMRYAASFHEGYSFGLFFDQRENRRKLLRMAGTRDSSPLQCLNLFAYTCGFSVSAAKAGMLTTSIDLSKKYLKWGRRNFELNDLPQEGHEFLFGGSLDWLARFAKKGKLFDRIIVDPPTFSRSREDGAFAVNKDFERLMLACFRVLAPGGVLLASTNSAHFSPEAFMESIERAALSLNRKIIQTEFVPQPFDYPVNKAEPSYLKTAWITLE